MENARITYDAATWVGRLSVHQDFWWFFSLVLWSVALLVWMRHPRRSTSWGWVPAAGVFTVGTALVQFGMFNPTFDLFQDRLIPGSVSNYRPAIVDPYWLGDIVIGALAAGLAGGWGWAAPWVQRAHWRRWLLIASLALLAGGHVVAPGVGGLALSLAVLGLGLTRWRAVQQDAAARLAFGLALLLPVFSTIGPVAATLGMIQRLGPPTPVGLGAAFFQLTLGALIFAGLLRGMWSRQHPATVLALRRDIQRAAVLAAVWLLAGLGFAVATGHDNRTEIQQNRLRTAAAQARVFDPSLLEPLADPRFRLETRSAVGEPVAAHSPWLATGVAAAAQRRLAQVVIATPFLDVARIVVLQDGWMVAVLSSEHPGQDGVVQLLRAATAEDRRRWADKEPYVESSPVHEIGYPYYCRAPIVAEDGRMLGWLDCVRREYYLSVERRWRAAPFVVTALGLALLGLALVQRQSGRERERARAEAEAADAGNRSKSAFLANVSHELRTPLQSILGHGELLERDPPPEQRRAHVEALRRQGELMLRLVNDLIDLSAVESGAFQLSPRAVDPAALVRDTMRGLQERAAAKGLQLECTIEPGVPAWVRVDGVRLQQVVINLLGNAVKFTARGRVQVQLAAERGVGDSWWLHCAVRDTGPGIPPAQQARLFRAFARLEQTAAQEGSGLGLAVAAALCRAMGGELTLESDGMSGSCFTAKVSAPESQAPAVEPGAPAAAAPDRRHPRVLVVEDNAALRELFTATLTERGARCRAASHGAGALQAVAAEAPEAIVMDLALPDGDSLVLVPRLRALAPQARIIVASAHASAADRARVLAAGVDAFLLKPVRLEELWAQIGAPAAAAAGVAPASGVAAMPDFFAAAPAARALVRQRFAEELPAWTARTAAAVAAGDCAAVRREAHYLRSGAIAVGAAELFDACSGLEEAAAAEDGARVKISWERCQISRAEWEKNR